MATNWHPQLIIFEVRMGGSNLRRLAEAHGFAKNTLYKALQRPWPNAHAVIARHLGRCRSEIWPEYYEEGGAPRRRSRADLKRNFENREAA